MKTLDKQKQALAALERVADVLEKCGGRGGKPGPCPTGGTGGTHPAVHSVKAHEASEKAHAASKMIPDHIVSGFSKVSYSPSKGAITALHHSENAHKAMREDGVLLGHGETTKKDHKAASEHHGKAADEHEKVAAAYKKDFPSASRAHSKAAYSHRYAAVAHHFHQA